MLTTRNPLDRAVILSFAHTFRPAECPLFSMHAPQENVRWCANLIQMGGDIDGSPAQQRLQQQVHLFLEVLISMRFPTSLFWHRSRTLAVLPTFVSAASCYNWWTPARASGQGGDEVQGIYLCA